MFEEFKQPDVTIRDGNNWEQWKVTGNNEIMAVCYSPDSYPQLTVFTESFDYFVKQFLLLKDEKESIMKNKVFDDIIRDSVERAIK